MAYGFAAVFQLVGHVAIAHDRPGHQLGEEREIPREIHKRALRLCAAVHVDGVAQRLKGVKRDAQRQMDLRRQIQPQQARNEARVLKVPERTQRKRQRAHERDLAIARFRFDNHARNLVHQRAGKHKKRVFPLAPAIKHQVGDEQKRVPRFAGHGIINADDHRQI